MQPKITDHSQGKLFQQRLSEQLNPKHKLFRLAHLIDWGSLNSEFQPLFSAQKGARAKPVRLVVGLLMLQSLFDCSDELVVEEWVENPYWQYFCGYDYLQWTLPLHPTSLVKWRKRLGVDSMEKILALTIGAALDADAAKKSSLRRVIVDTTVMPKNITYPTDAKLLYRAIQLLAKRAKRFNVPLRQSYARTAKRAMYKAARYIHARQMKRAQREIKWLRTRLGRLIRDVQRKASTDVAPQLEGVLNLCTRLQEQRRNSKDKIYSVHEPEVVCVAKGKAGKKYEFGCKASIVVTHKEGLALSVQALDGNPYDGHTLKQALKCAEDLSGMPITEAFADQGYRGHGITDCDVHLSHHRSSSPALKRRIKRRQAIEPHIGHMKSEGRLDRSYLKGKIGDRLNAILCGIGHNLRLILRHFRFSTA